MKDTFSLFILFLFVLLVTNMGIGSTTYAEVTTPNQTELIEVRKVLNQAVEAINLKDIHKMSPLFSKDFTLITLDNKKITSLESFLSYWEGLFTGDKATVKKLILDIQLDPEPIYLDKKIAIIQGTANENFIYYKGGEQVLHTRWTAVLEKKPHNKTEWQISAIHHSSGITKSMLTELQSQMLKTALGGLVIGLVLGMFFISLSRKK